MRRQRIEVFGGLTALNLRVLIVLLVLSREMVVEEENQFKVLL